MPPSSRRSFSPGVFWRHEQPHEAEGSGEHPRLMSSPEVRAVRMRPLGLAEERGVAGAETLAARGTRKDAKIDCDE